MRSLLALVLLMLPTLAHAQGNERIVVLESGLVSGKSGKMVPAPGTATGFTREIDNFKMVKQATDRRETGRALRHALSRRRDAARQADQGAMHHALSRRTA